MSRSFIQNCRWVTASFTSSSMKDLCQKWKVKLIFRGAWNSLMVWPDWPCPDPYILRQINGTGCTLPLVRFHSCDFVFRALSHRSRCQYTITSFSVSNWESSKPSTVAVILHPAEGLMSRTLTSLNRSTASEHWRCVFFHARLDAESASNKHTLHRSTNSHDNYCKTCARRGSAER